jgi:hypothetical protein
MKAKGPSTPAGPESRSAIAEQIALEASRLARSASANGFPLLVYLIDMVVLEAWREATESEPGPDGHRNTIAGMG